VLNIVRRILFWFRLFAVYNYIVTSMLCNMVTNAQKMNVTSSFPVIQIHSGKR
jgi:hypothetical protein